MAAEDGRKLGAALEEGGGDDSASHSSIGHCILGRRGRWRRRMDGGWRRHWRRAVAMTVWAIQASDTASSGGVEAAWRRRMGGR